MKKKLVSLALLVTVGVSLGGCVPSAKNDFAKKFDSRNTAVNDGKYNNISVNLGISDIKMNEKSNDPVSNMVATQLKASKFKFETAIDSKDEKLSQTKMTFDIMGMNIPVEIIASEKEKQKLYLSTDGLSSFFEIAQSLSEEEGLELDPTLLDSFKGKYVDLYELSDTTETTKSLADISKETAGNKKFNTAYAKEVQSYIKGLDNKKFEKKDGKISHTFTFNEIKDLIDLGDKVVKSNKEFKYAEGESIKDLKKDLTDTFSDLSCKVTVNDKNDDFDVELTMKPTEKEAKEAGFSALTLKGSFKYKATKQTVKMPSKDKILSSEEIEEVILAANQESAAISDEDFDEFIKEIETLNKEGAIDDETKQELLEGYKDVFTEEQYKKLEDAMK